MCVRAHVRIHAQTGEIQGWGDDTGAPKNGQIPRPRAGAGGPVPVDGPRPSARGRESPCDSDPGARERRRQHPWPWSARVLNPTRTLRPSRRSDSTRRRACAGVLPGLEAAGSPAQTRRSTPGPALSRGCFAAPQPALIRVSRRRRASGPSL